jgi:hypothetical protein
MRAFILVIFCFAMTDLFAQTITGTVREKGSGLPMPFANVFISNTTLGSATNREGEFRIAGNMPQEIEVVASFVGYFTEVKKVSTRSKGVIQVDFELAINESNLTEIQLKARRDKSWEREYRRFKEVFLALNDDPFKSDVEILNPWVVDFEKIKVRDGSNYTMASAQEPLKIVNRALGYEIAYYLQDFRMAREGARFYGQAFYEEISADQEQKEAWEQSRDANYYSSIRHLNQSILLNIGDSKHFRIYHAIPDDTTRHRSNVFQKELNESILALPNDSILRRPLGDGTFRIFLPGRMEIHHLDKPWDRFFYVDIAHAISWIEAPQGYYDIDRKGILLNPTQLRLSGYLGRQRMARILPLDFEPISDFLVNEMEEDVVIDPSAKFDRLREKPWLTSSKSYYYPGETVWLGGQMLYQEPAWLDTLSRVLYLDLVSSDSLVQSMVFPIQDGKISGGFTLSENLPVGDYALRAYTNWSRNFSDTDAFLMPLPILDPAYRPKRTHIDEEAVYGDVDVSAAFTISDSSSYRVMDLELSFWDEFQNPIETQFVLSMTDAEEVAVLSSSTIDSALKWLDRPLPMDFLSTWTFPIEYGISIQGKFIPDNRRRPLSQSITLVRGDLEDYGQVQSDSLGIFWATGLYYKDIAQVAISAVDARSKPFGSIALIPNVRPDLPRSISKLIYQTEPRDGGSQLLDTSEDYLLLDEFVKEGLKTGESTADRNYGYGTPTREMGGEELAKMVNWEQVFARINPFRNYNYGETTGPPLIIMNGQKLPLADPSEVLSNVSPAEVESVKMYTGTIGKSTFGMMGYAGVIMIETKKGVRMPSEPDRKFNPAGFKIFQIPGFSDFTEFPTNPPSDQYLRRKQTIYWNPHAESDKGVHTTRVKVPYGVKVIHVKLEGRTGDGDGVSKLLELKL